MTVFATKEAFTTLGLEPLTPSHLHASQDCTICLCPMQMNPLAPTSTNTNVNANPTTSSSTSSSPFHPAVRILACNHIHGAECLNAWLDVGNTCPTCKRLLFEAADDQATRGRGNGGFRISQHDVNLVVRELGPRYGVGRVMREVVRVLGGAFVMVPGQGREEGDQVRGRDWLDSEDDSDSDSDGDGDGIGDGEVEWETEEDDEDEDAGVGDDYGDSDEDAEGEDEDEDEDDGGQDEGDEEDEEGVDDME